MSSHVRRGWASGPAEWFLVFLQARDTPPRARAGSAVGPAEWLLVFLDAAKMGGEAHRAAPAATGPVALRPGGELPAERAVVGM